MAVTGFMIDMDGTVYMGGNLILGAREFIAALDERSIPYVFLTNNSSRSRARYQEKLARLGIDVGIEHVLTSNIATIRYVLEKYPGQKVFPLAVPEVVDEIRAAGIETDDVDPDIVYLAYDKTVDFDKLNKAFHFILGGAKLIATHPDDVCPTEDSYDVDIGPFIRLFESLSGCKAEVIGKPNRRMLEMAAVEMGADPVGTIMVGDRLYTDIRMAADTGIRSILVLSGETSREEAEASQVKATYTVGSVAEIPGMLDRL